MNWLDKLERKFGKYAIRNLMYYIVTINFFTYLLMYFDKSNTFINKLLLNPALVMKGEVWRLITFIFVPEPMSPFWIIIALYFYFLAGRGLEQEWGSFKFNIYYIFGIIGTILSAFISGASVTATYINLSLFLAFARIYPDYEVLLFFILPIKVKYMAYFNWAIIIYSIITVPQISYKIAAVVVIINYFIFFGKDIMVNGINRNKSYKRRREFESKIQYKDTIHRCTVCGLTEKDDPDMEFRYCSKCNGYYEYCSKHLKDHEHKQ